jgi:acyl carrier protein
VIKLNKAHIQSVESIETKVRDFLSGNSLLDISQAHSDTDLFKQGYIDSYGYIELIKFLETEFQILFSDEELVSGNLNTFANVAHLVRTKLESAA